MSRMGLQRSSGGRERGEIGAGGVGEKRAFQGRGEVGGMDGATVWVEVGVIKVRMQRRKIVITPILPVLEKKLRVKYDEGKREKKWRTDWRVRGGGKD